MTIVRRKIKRQITEEEALRLKDVKPFKGMRQDAKQVNFSTIFGVSYKRFSASALETSWDIEKVNAFIKEKHLEDSVDHMAEKHPLVEPKLWKYYASAEYIKNQFFSTYKGLQERIKRNEELAKANGYIRSHHGAIRRTPLLSLCMNEDGKLRKDEDMKEISGLINIVANSTIQTDESSIVNMCIDEWVNDSGYVEYALPSGTVHDSVDFYLDKSHAIETLKQLKLIFERSEDWQKGIIIPIDLTIVDLEDSKQYYKHGIDYEKFLELHGNN